MAVLDRGLIVQRGCPELPAVAVDGEQNAVQASGRGATFLPTEPLRQPRECTTAGTVAITPLRLKILRPLALKIKAMNAFAAA